jgi:UDP-2,3-diacylglucosamine pyrophosphatase LpxH
VHLGSAVCRAKELREFLAMVHEDEIMADELVINGDLFDSLDFRKLRGSHWKVLSKLRQISKRKRVVWIGGNHDGPAEAISHLIGVDFLDDHRIVGGGREILVLHGDVFDDFLSDHPILTRLADTMYRTMQGVWGGAGLALAAKRGSKTFLRCSALVKERARVHMRSSGCDTVCCGHTHMAEADGDYFNSGCWTEHQCHYLEVRDGIVNLRPFQKA